MPPVKPDSTNPDATFHFVGRANQVEQFRNSVRYLLGTMAAPTGPHFTHIFIAHGEGGMGKSSLLQRWRQVAVEEEVPTERVISIPLNGRTYPTVEALASTIREAIAANFPQFDQHYQAAQLRRTELRDGYNALYEEWQRYAALRETGNLGEMRKASRQNLALAETQRAKASSLYETPVMLHQAEDSMNRLRSLDRFESVNGRVPNSFDELLQYELGADDAALFASEDRWSAAAFGSDLCTLAEDPTKQPLVLSIDTYELADQHDDWLRALLLEAGDHVLTLIGGRNPIHRRDGHQRMFSQGLRTYVQAFDLGREALNLEEINELITLIIEREPTEPEVSEIQRLSRGVPLAVQQLAEQLRENGNLAVYRDLRTGELNNNQIVHAITTRFLSYVIEDQREDPASAERKEQERLRIQALAIPVRADEELMCALWGVDMRDVMRINRELRSAHSFVYAGETDYGMHDLVREFIRADMWGREPAGWLQLRQGVERGATLIERRLDQWRDNPPEAQFDNPDWRQATLNKLNLLLWLNQLPAARRLLLETWIAARHYHKDMSEELEDLASELTPKSSDWSRISAAISQPQSKEHPRRRDYRALESYLGELSNYTRMLWYVGQGQQLEPRYKRLQAKEDKVAVEQAIHYYRLALALNSNWLPLTESLARCYIQLGDYERSPKQSNWEQAIDYFTTALIFSTDSAYIYFSRAYAYDEIKNYSAAINDLNRVIEINPLYSNAFNNRGNAYFGIKNFNSSIKDYNNSIRLNPDSDLPYRGLGDVYREMRQFNNAIKAYKRGINIGNSQIGSLIQLGTLYYEMNQHKKAIEVFKKAIERQPEDEIAHNNLAYMYSLTGERDQAKYHYHQSLKKNSDYFWSLLGLARISEEEGDLETKRKYLIRAQKVFRNDEKYYERACFESIAGRIDRALKYLEKAIKKGEHTQEWARQDPAFAPIANDPRFRALVGLDRPE
jgi:tetratricopeptide (TPR) repeat protein